MDRHYQENLLISDYDYELPEDRIAKYPLSQRDASNLLIFRNGKLDTDWFYNIGKHLETGSLLVFNDTRVVKARLEFVKSTGARIEVFCIEPSLPADYERMFVSQGSCSWRCMVGNLKRWKAETLQLHSTNGRIPVSLRAEKKERKDELQTVQFSWEPAMLTFADILQHFGATPLPPYLNREPEALDTLRYQTIYARHDGSVAAPTAGLHFTDELLERLESSGIPRTSVTLHVGAGTFRPVLSDTPGEHTMHTEHFSVSLKSLLAIQQRAGRIVATGTTSMRTLESLYLIGRKLCKNPSAVADISHIEQWEGIRSGNDIPASEAIQAVIDCMHAQGTDILHASTQLMILPGYQFRMVDALITNYHQPRSTLLLLVAAFIGKNWEKVYEHALQNNFRFLSYGDSSLLYKGS